MKAEEQWVTGNSFSVVTKCPSSSAGFYSGLCLLQVLSSLGSRLALSDGSVLRAHPQGISLRGGKDEIRWFHPGLV